MRYARSLHEDADGTLWIGTRAGLVRVKDGRMERLDAEDGLPDSVTNGIVDDRAGNLWVGCTKGVYRIAKRDLDDRLAGRSATLRPALFGREDGILAGQAVGGTALRARDKSLWFGTTLGVATISAARLGATAPPPPVYIEKVVVDETEYDPGRNVVVPPGDRRLVLRFTALAFEAPEKIRFRYLLENFERGWRDAGEQREVTYTRVTPGATPSASRRATASACAMTLARSCAWSSDRTSTSGRSSTSCSSLSRAVCCGRVTVGA